MDQTPTSQTPQNTTSSPSIQPIEPVRFVPEENTSPVPPTPPPPFSPSPETSGSNNTSSVMKWMIVMLSTAILFFLIYIFLPQNKLSIKSQSLGSTIHVSRVQTTKPASIVIIAGDELNRPEGGVIAVTNVTIEPGTYTDFNIPFIKPDPKSGITDIVKGTYFGVLVENIKENPDDQLPPPLKNIFGIPVQIRFKLL